MAQSLYAVRQFEKKVLELIDSLEGEELKKAISQEAEQATMLNEEQIIDAFLTAKVINPKIGVWRRSPEYQELINYLNDTYE